MNLDLVSEERMQQAGRKIRESDLQTLHQLDRVEKYIRADWFYQKDLQGL